MQIPRERLLPIIQRQVEMRDEDSGRSFQSLRRYGINQAAFEIAFECGLKQESVARSLGRFLREDIKYVNFKTADEWLVGLGIPQVWHAELGDLYELGTSPSS